VSDAPSPVTGPLRVAVGADHGGVVLKDLLAGHLAARGVEVLDLGTHGTDRVDYPDFGVAVGRAVAAGEAHLGIAVCGSGIGIGIAANKVPGVRAATVHDETSARLARQHNDANVLCLGERLIGVEVARSAVDAWLDASFEGGRHEARVAKLDALLCNDGV
jgi:ribose 5-phosphate isomerase B